METDNTEFFVSRLETMDSTQYRRVLTEAKTRIAELARLAQQGLDWLEQVEAMQQTIKHPTKSDAIEARKDALYDAAWMAHGVQNQAARLTAFLNKWNQPA